MILILQQSYRVIHKISYINLHLTDVLLPHTFRNYERRGTSRENSSKFEIFCKTINYCYNTDFKPEIFLDLG